MTENTEKTIVKLDKYSSKVMMWVQSAQSKDPDRSNLTGTLFENGYVTCADGMRLSITEAPEAFEDINGLVSITKIRSGENIVEIKPVEADFPKYDKVIPTEEPVLKISVSPRLLVELLKGLDKDSPVTFNFHGTTLPIEIHGKVDHQSTYSILMPMHNDDEHERPDVNK